MRAEPIASDGSPKAPRRPTIGVFDSGFGGLTVLKALLELVPDADYVYFGDTDKYKLIEAIDPDWNGALPHTLLIAPGGEVLYRETGEIDFLELRRKIVPALNKVTPWPGV